MHNQKRISRKARRLVKLGARIGCLLVLVSVAEYINKPNTFQAMARFTCLLNVGYGHMTVLSCGSSAGNFIMTCATTNPGSCDIAPPINDGIADANCEQYAREGCPETLFGDEPLMVQDAR